MASLDYTVPAKVTITNIIDSTAPAVINGQALTGKRQVMTRAEAIAAGFTVYDYLLDREGNFIIEETEDATSTDATTSETGSSDTTTTESDSADTQTAATTAKAIDSDNILVVVRQSVKNTDRMIQLYRTQQSILLPAGDELILKAQYSGAAAYYASLAVEGEIEVTIEPETETTTA